MSNAKHLTPCISSNRLTKYVTIWIGEKFNRTETHNTI